MKTNNFRKGLGKNKGKGYYNILPLDSHIHSLSAKGVKTRTYIVTADGFAYEHSVKAKSKKEAVKKVNEMLEGELKKVQEIGGDVYVNNSVFENEVNAKGKNYNMMKEIDQLEKMAEKEISESRYYPENQKKALKRFFKQARTLVGKKGSVGIKGWNSTRSYEDEIKNPNDLYKFWKKFDTFGVSITGRMTGNQVFRKKYGSDTVREWYKPIYEETTKSFNKTLGQALKKV